jgi:hypothetical protein
MPIYWKIALPIIIIICIVLFIMRPFTIPRFKENKALTNREMIVIATVIAIVIVIILISLCIWWESTWYWG